MLPARTGLRLLLCSDGLTGEVIDERIRLHLAAGLSVAETAGALVDAALAAGGKDNITVIVIEVVDGGLGDDDYQNTAPGQKSGRR